MRVLISVCPTGLRDFPQLLSTNGVVVAQIRSRCLPFASLPVQCSFCFSTSWNRSVWESLSNKSKFHSWRNLQKIKVKERPIASSVFTFVALRMWKLNFTKFWFSLLFCMGAKLGLLHWARNISLGSSRIVCWGSYLGLRGRKWQDTGENYSMRSFIFVFFTKYCSAGQIKERRWAGHVACLGRKQKCVQGFGGDNWGKESTWKT